MPVTVRPDRFLLVDFDAGTIGREADDVADRLGLGDRRIDVTVDESTFLARVVVVVGDAGDIDIAAESGAFEDTKRPRQYSAGRTRHTLARALLTARDRLDGFAPAPPDPDVGVAERAAWNAFVAGRLARLGFPVAAPRYQYDFRNRHGFTDVADAVFEQLWSAEALDWAAVTALSARAAPAD